MKRRKTRKSGPAPLPQLPEGGAVIGYARVSTTEQNLDMQLSALRSAGCHRIHSETLSAVSKKRPELEHALRSLRPGDTFVVWKLDRLARSMQDLLTRWKYINESGARLRSLTEQIDTTTAIGTLMFHILGALAEFERGLIMERIAEGMRAYRDRGGRLGAMPMFGDNVRKAMRADRAAGLSHSEIAERYECSRSTAANYTRGVKPRKPRG